MALNPYQTNCCMNLGSQSVGINLQVEKSEAADAWIGPDLPCFVALSTPVSCNVVITS